MSLLAAYAISSLGPTPERRPVRNGDENRDEQTVHEHERNALGNNSRVLVGS